MDAPIALIDSNIFAYVFDAQDLEKQKRAKELIAKCWKGEARYAVSVQNLAEFAVIVTEKATHPLPEKTVQEFIRTIVSFDGWIKIVYSGETIAEALKIRSGYHIHFWDALIIATMQEHAIGSIYSEDRHLARVPSVTLINPFEPGSDSNPDIA
jgi:predicted nucleic acid-binding protein